MSLGILGKKIGMEQIYDAEGNRIPVTLVQVGPCVVTQVRTVEKDGVAALQVGFGDWKEKQVPKSAKGHFAKAKTSAKRFIREFRIAPAEVEKYQLGQEVALDTIKVNDMIDVCGISKGKGFAGVMKRHHMKGFPASHGTHEYFRHGGSAGCRFPQGTIKGLRMPGHLGTDRVTVQNLKLVEVRDGAKANEKIFLVAGAIPGNRGGFVTLTKAIKNH